MAGNFTGKIGVFQSIFMRSGDWKTRHFPVGFPVLGDQVIFDCETVGFPVAETARIGPSFQPEFALETLLEKVTGNDEFSTGQIGAVFGPFPVLGDGGIFDWKRGRFPAPIGAVLELVSQ
jgi:hypothetical protein